MKSLERQLQTSLATVLVLILIGLMLIAGLSTRSLLLSFVTSRLEHDSKRILDTLLIDTETVNVRWSQLDPIYNTANSGHYYVIQFHNKQGAKTIFRSPSLKGNNLPTPESIIPTTLHDIPGPEHQHLIIWSKKYNKNGKDVIISIAEDMSLYLQNRRYFTFLFIGMGLIGIILMLALQRMVIRRLFKHLASSRREVKQIESGERQQLSEQVPTEIYPLVKEFNHSLSLMQQRMERSRNSLGNLAHALKTPLSLLMQQLDSSENLEMQQAKKQAERIRQLTERELKRARMAGLGNTTQRFNPHEELSALIEVLKQAHQKNDLEISYQIADEVKLFGDREDMLELFGNLLDNACKWADSTVTCSVAIQKNNSNTVIIIIEDDGAGETAKEREQLTERGTRLDESVEGHGLGLAICKDIVKLYAGTIRFDRSDKLGGFLVEIKLP